MMYRILHFADLHLDASFASAGMTPSVARQRRGDLRTALKRLINKTKELGVSAITIGGDLYEYERVSSDTINFLKAQFESIAPIPVIIAPGNHDPYLPGSPYRQIEWSSNVFVFSTPELSPHELSSEITLWGAAHDSPSFRVNLFERFKVPRSGIQIILLHASDTTRVPAGKDAHCPFTPKQIAQSGAKFSLFGHYHKALLEPTHKPLYSYPGSPEPLGFDEEGTHYALLAEVVDERVSAELIPVNAVEYRKVDIDIGVGCQ